MNAEALSRSLSYLPDSMIGEAIVSRAKVRIYQKPWFRAAACIALVLAMLFGISFPWITGEKYITAPSILAVKAYAFENGQPKEYELEEGVRFYHHKELDYYNMAISCVPGLPMTFSFDGDGLILDISVDGDGHFTDGRFDIVGNEFHERGSDDMLGKQFSIQNNRTIYWHPYEEIGSWNEDEDEDGMNIAEQAYIDVILKRESNIVGYVLIEVVDIGDWRYCAYLLESEYYPKIFGQYQGISEEYVQQQMETVKQNRT